MDLKYIKNFFKYLPSIYLEFISIGSWRISEISMTIRFYSSI